VGDARQQNWHGLGFWTDQRIAILKAGVAAGDTFREIASRVGCTKNAALAKSHRLGLIQPPHAAKPGAGWKGDRPRIEARPTRPATPPRSVPKVTTAPIPSLRPAPAQRAAPRLAIAGNGQVFDKSQCGPPRDVPDLSGPAWKPLPGVEPVSLLDLQPIHCKWPLDGFVEPHCCGAGRAGSGPYCDAHELRSLPSAAAKAWVEKQVAFAVKKARAA
jgi:hypothetical protein